MTVGVRGIQGSFASLEGDLQAFIEEYKELECEFKKLEVENEALKEKIDYLLALTAHDKNETVTSISDVRAEIDKED
jgi:hypothetical protein